jgi:hypothetical protein
MAVICSAINTNNVSFKGRQTCAVKRRQGHSAAPAAYIRSPPSLLGPIFFLLLAPLSFGSPGPLLLVLGLY